MANRKKGNGNRWCRRVASGLNTKSFTKLRKTPKYVKQERRKRLTTCRERNDNTRKANATTEKRQQKEEGQEEEEEQQKNGGRRKSDSRRSKSRTTIGESDIRKTAGGRETTER